MAVWGTTIAAGLAVGPILAGALVAAFGWRSVYVLLVALTLLTLAVGWFGIEESRGAGKRVDWAGLVVFAAALGALIFALVHGASAGFSSPLIVVVLAAAVLGLVGFCVLEWRERDPMLEIALFRRPAFTGAALAALASAMANFGLKFYMLIYLLRFRGDSPVLAGVQFLPITGVSLVVSPLSGRLMTRVAPRILMASSLALIGVGDLLLHGISASTSYASLLPGFVLVGIGAGAINPPLGQTAVGVVARAQAGMASGVNNTFRQLGTALGIAVFGAVSLTVVSRHFAGTPLAGDHGVLGLVASGNLHGAAAAAPASARGVVAALASPAFLAGLNAALLGIAAVAFAGALLAAVLVRSRDFVVEQGADGGPPHPVGVAHAHGNAAACGLHAGVDVIPTATSARSPLRGS